MEEPANAILILSVEGSILKAESTKPSLGFTETELCNKKLSSLLVSPYKEHFETMLMDNATDGRHTELLATPTFVEIEHKDKKLSQVFMIIRKEEGEKEDTLRVILEKCEFPSAVVNVNSTGSLISTTNAEIFGYRSNQLVHKPISTLLPSIHAKGISASNIDCTNAVGKSATGAYFWVSMQRSVIKLANFELANLTLTKIDPRLYAFFVIGADELIQSCNATAVMNLFGYRSRDLTGQHIHSFITKKNIKLFQDYNNLPNEEAKKELVDCCIKPIRTHFNHKDGTQVPIYIQAFPFQREVLYTGTTQGIVEPFFSLRISRIPLGEGEFSRIGDYLLLETIGVGSSGKVKRAIHETTKEQVAIKVITKKGISPVDLERAHRETSIMLQLRHKHIVKLHHVIETDHKLYLVMDLVSGVDLMKYVIDKGGLKEDAARSIFVQLLSALMFCHHVKVIHRDVKHKNIIIDPDTQEIVLIDFGLSNWNEEGTLKDSYCGTPAFASPEMILGHKYDGKLVDVWSAGVVLYSMLTCKFPFSNAGELIRGSFEDPVGCSAECIEIIRSMLIVDTNSRATLQRVWDHNWCKPSIDTVYPPFPIDAEKLNMSNGFNGNNKVETEPTTPADKSPNEEESSQNEETSTKRPRRSSRNKKEVQVKKSRRTNR